MLGKNIKELRKEKGLTQTELAREIGVTQGAIYFWEKEVNEPTAGFLVRLAKFFEISVDELLSFEPSRSEEIPSKNAELIALYNKLTTNQQNMILNIIKEMIKP